MIIRNDYMARNDAKFVIQQFHDSTLKQFNDSTI